MAEEALDEANVDTSLEEVGGVGVAQGMGSRFLGESGS